MTIQEMHELFRVLGQQMGMQKVRGILPESIDAVINTSIAHCVRQIITSNVTANFGNVVAIQKNKISVINALRTLYIEKELNIEYDSEEEEEVVSPIVKSLFYDFDIFSFIDCNVSYTAAAPYKYVSTRLIEPNLISEVERDYLLRPNSKFPVATIVSTVDKYKKIIPSEYYTDSEGNPAVTEETTKIGTLIEYNFYTGNSKPTRVKASFIKYPKVVKLSEDEEECVDCDLPIHLHHMVVEEAVRLYLQSVHLTSGNSNSNQQQDKN